jgi:hypothetical protein
MALDKQRREIRSGGDLHDLVLERLAHCREGGLLPSHIIITSDSLRLSKEFLEDASAALNRNPAPKYQIFFLGIPMTIYQTGRAGVSIVTEKTPCARARDVVSASHAGKAAIPHHSRQQDVFAGTPRQIRSHV